LAIKPPPRPPPPAPAPPRRPAASAQPALARYHPRRPTVTAPGASFPPDRATARPRDRPTAAAAQKKRRPQAPPLVMFNRRSENQGHRNRSKLDHRQQTETEVLD